MCAMPDPLHHAQPDGDPHATAAEAAPRAKQGGTTNAASETQDGTPAQKSPESTVDADQWQTRTTVTATPAPTLGVIPIPGYEVQGILGRGGMGVVYKAVHQKLNRQLPVKMILTRAP